MIITEIYDLADISEITISHLMDLKTDIAYLI